MRHLSAVVVAILIVVRGIVGALTLPLQVMVILGIAGVAAFIGWLDWSERIFLLPFVFGFGFGAVWLLSRRLHRGRAIFFSALLI